MMYLGKTVHNKEMKRFEVSFSKFVRDFLNEMIIKNKKDEKLRKGLHS